MTLVYKQNQEAYKHYPTLTEREEKLMVDALRYLNDPYGAPGHLYLMLIGKLAECIMDYYAEETDVE